jgi:hypothetical protein
MVNREIAPTRTHDGPSVAVDPMDPSMIVVADVDIQNGHCLTHISRDAGLTWVEGRSPQPPEFSSCTPQSGNRFSTGPATSLTFDTDGTLYYAFAAARPGDQDSRSVLLGRSTNQGQSWTTSVVHLASPGFGPAADSSLQPSVMIDDSATPHRIVVSWSRAIDFTQPNAPPDRVFVAVSTDGGRHFGRPVDLGPGRAPSMAASKGIVLAFFAQAFVFPPPAKGFKIYQARSTDGGKSFKLSVINPGAVRVSSPRAAVGPDGSLVITWYDNHLAAPNTVRDDVFAMRSTDQGRSWTRPVAVSPIPTHPPGKNVNQLYPTIAIAPNGRVDVAWYDYRNDPVPIPSDARPSYLGQFADLFVASSDDGGKTFGPAVRVTDHTIDRRIGTWNGQYFYVVAPGLASSDDAFSVAWSDTRNGTPDSSAQDIFFTAGLFPKRASGLGLSSRGIVLSIELFGAGVGITLIVAAAVLRSRSRRVKAA